MEHMSTCIYMQHIHVVMNLSPECDSMGFTSMCMSPFLVLFLSVAQRNEAPVNLVTRWLLLYLVATATEPYLVWVSSNVGLVNACQTEKK